MNNSNNISLKELAEKIKGKYWSKGDLERIYLDRGHNTKKMSTKTYVYQREDGSFGVSCFIECPSQPFAWIKSQQDEIIQSVEENIEWALIEDLYILTNANGEYLDENINVEELGDMCESDFFFTEAQAQKAANEHNVSFKIIKKQEWRAAEKAISEKRSQERKEIEQKEIIQVAEKKEKEKTYPESPIENIKEGVNVMHSRFGQGLVKSLNGSTAIIDFNGEEKTLLIKFAKLHVIKN